MGWSGGKLCSGEQTCSEQHTAICELKGKTAGRQGEMKVCVMDRDETETWLMSEGKQEEINTCMFWFPLSKTLSQMNSHKHACETKWTQI